MTVQPMYGYKPEVEGKQFRLTFFDCLYISEFDKELNTDCKSAAFTDFNYWGRNNEGLAMNNSEELKKGFELLNKIPSDSQLEYKIYYFGSLGIIDIVILCKRTALNIIEKQSG